MPPDQSDAGKLIAGDFEKRILRLAITSPEGWCGQDTIYRNDAIRLAREADAEIRALRARLEAAETRLAEAAALTVEAHQLFMAGEAEDGRAKVGALRRFLTHPAPKEAEDA